MTIARVIPAPLRSGLIVAAGASLVLVPFALRMSAAAIVTGIAVGALTIALGAAGTASEGRGTLPSSAHAVFDRGLAAGLLLAGVVFRLAGDAPAFALFAGAGVATLALSSLTTYSNADPTV